MATSDLELELRRAVSGEVRFDPAGRALYAADASNYRFPPIGVVTPKSRDEVIAAVAVCRKFGRRCSRAAGAPASPANAATRRSSWT